MANKKQPAECPKCHEPEVRLRRFYRGPVQIVEGPRAGKFVVDCAACGLVGTVAAEDARLLPLGRGVGVAVPLIAHRSTGNADAPAGGARLFMGR